MFKLLITALVIAGTGVSLDKLPPRKLGSAKVLSLPDAGLPEDPAQIVGARRAEFAARMDLAMEQETKDKKRPISVQKILWSTSAVNSSNDGAIVLLNVGDGKTVGLFFYYRDGAWHDIPDDFK